MKRTKKLTCLHIFKELKNTFKLTITKYIFDANSLILKPNVVLS